jgi:signal transduction histidine kinase
MRPFPRGRLFWKILFFFFLAQAVTVIGTGLAIWAAMPDGGMPPLAPPGREGRPPAPMPGAHPPPDGRPERAGEPAGPPPRDRPFERRGEPLAPRLLDPPLLHLAAGAVVSLVFAALLAAYIARPVRRLREALQAGASGQLVTDLADAMGHRRDELADLCRDFDRMAHHIDQLMQGQRRLLHDVSHEMRSPLARLSAIVGLVRQQPERLDDCLNLLEHESARMDRLVSELLTLSRLESGMLDPGEEIFDLAEVLADVVADAAPEAGQTGCRVELAANAEAPVRGDAEMLHRVFDNLLRNALAYASGGGWIGLRLEARAEAIEVCVEDRGPGVLSADLNRLFEPFFRGSQAPARKGHGLGLAIARQIVANHGGGIHAENRREGGLRVCVRLPRATAGSPAGAVKAPD